jgi:hypothetical protein
MEAREARIRRLQLKLAHWIEHNRDHAASFRKAAQEAEELGFLSVSGGLQAAATRMDEVSAVLATAKEELA